MAIRATGAGLRAGMATRKLVVCNICGAKTAVAANQAGKVACDGCGVLYRANGRRVPGDLGARGKGAAIQPTPLELPPQPRNPRSPGGSRDPNAPPRGNGHGR